MSYLSFNATASSWFSSFPSLSKLIGYSVLTAVFIREIRHPINKPVALSMHTHATVVPSKIKHSDLSAWKVYQMNFLGTRRQAEVIRIDATTLIGM
jgi:hypothetical protein